MTSNICDVCESPTANTLHFGGRCCKACAAFFRRTVSMGMVYECVNGGLVLCRIHHELRMICRQCRFLRCLRSGMKRELVQAKRDEREMSPKVKGRSKAAPPTPPEPPQSIEYCAPSTSASPQDPYSLARTPSMSMEMDEQTIELHLRMEAALNDRRRIMYTDVRMRDVFDTLCECPYEPEHLRPFNYRTFVGFDRHDFIMLYDYTRALPAFEYLSRSEKNLLYRFSCAVDCMINSAYYTARLGQQQSLLILFNAEYICMDPLPLSGDEPGAEQMFESKQDFIKYKSLMPTKLRQWQNMAVPFFSLNISFEELALLKALTIWHISYYKLSPAGRIICSDQRDHLLRALHRLCEERGESPAERVGNLLLAMSFVLEQVHELTNSLVMITFFDILKCDAVLVDVLDNNIDC